MELEEFIKKVETLAAAISGEKGKILAYIFKHGERTYDQLAMWMGDVRRHIEELEQMGLVKSRKEVLHPFKNEEVYTLSTRGEYYLRAIEEMFEKEFSTIFRQYSFMRVRGEVA